MPINMLKFLLLSTEDENEYRQMLENVLENFKPLDPIKEDLLKHYVYDTLNLNRAKQHATLAIERRYQETREFRLLRAKARKNREEERARVKLRQAGTKPEDIARLAALEQNVLSAVTDIENILESSDTEREHNAAFEKSMEFIKDLDRMVQMAHGRRRDTLHMLEFYEAGLAQKARVATEKALQTSRSNETNGEEANALPEVKDAPSIAPTIDGETNDVATQNRSEPTQ